MATPNLCIIQVTSLEALLPDKRISSPAGGALEAAKDAVQTIRDAHPRSSPKWLNIDHLLSRLSGLRREAIGTTLREYVSEVVKRNLDLGEPTATTRQLKNLYDVRSKLIHDGLVDSLSVTDQLAFLRDFVPRLLETLYREAASGTAAVRE